MSEILNQSEISHRQNLEVEAERQKHNKQMALVNARLEMLRTAKDVLIENKRNLPVGEREVTEHDIVSFARTLISFLEE